MAALVVCPNDIHPKSLVDFQNKNL